MKTQTLFTPLLLSSAKPRKKEYALYDAQCDGLALRVQPNGAKSWVCWHRENRKTRKITLGKFEDLSLDDARRAFRSMHGGNQWPGPVPRADMITFSNLCKAFINAKRGSYTELTLSCLGTYLDTQLLPALGNRPVNKIATSEIADWFYSYSRHRPGGANQALGHFTTILNWAKSERLVSHDLPNPASAISTNPRRARGQLLTTDQLQRLAGVLDKATQQQREAVDAVRLILLTGCRSGEILRLTWREVVKDRLKLKRTKTGPREVVLSDAAVEHLTRMRKTRRSKFVFPSKTDPRRPRTSISGLWTRFKQLASLPETVRLHDLRHTYASHAIMSGETLSMTGKLLGHRSPESTKRYAHLDARHLSKAADKVSKRVSELLG